MRVKPSIILLGLLLAVFAVWNQTRQRAAQPSPTEPTVSDAHGTHSAHSHAGHKHAHAEGHGTPPPGVISLDVFSTGARVHVLLGRSGSPATLDYLYSDDGVAWSGPVQVSSGLPAPVGLRRGNDARLCATPNALLAIWSERGTGWGGGGPFVTALSTDGGKTWTRAGNPADDNSTGGHAFASFALDSVGNVHLVWLDSRNKRQGLRYARSADQGRTWSPNVTIDDETCECCWNTLAAPAPGEIAVVYRDKNPRDMTLTVSSDGGKTWAAAPTGGFKWQFQGCPEVGAGLCALPRADAATQPYLALVWTGETQQRGLYLLGHGGPAGTPRRLGPPAASKPDLARNANGELAAVYAAMVGETHAVYGCKSRDGGATWSEPQQLSGASAFANFPRVVPLADAFLVLWTESEGSADTTWKFARF